MKRLFPSLPKNPALPDVFNRFPESVAVLREYHDMVLRSEGSLSIGQRELIAAYVSCLNACDFCTGGHTVFVRAYGIDLDVIEAVLADPKTAPVDDNLKPILAYVEVLTQTPTRLTEAHAEAVYKAGWNEEALFEAVQVCALFNMMNRIVEGTGIATYPDDPRTLSSEDYEARSKHTYTGHPSGIQSSLGGNR